MTEDIEDLTPFFEDRCWMFVHLARQAHVGVILRRGPTEWWRVTLWDTQSDRFEAGQWFRGHLYPDRCDISPDGTNLAVTVGENGPIRILSLRGLPEQRIRVKKPKGIRSVDWAGDGKGFFLSAQQAGTEIWHVDLRGNAQVLWTTDVFLGEAHEARPSPDGRHLAIQTWATSGNLWMMENF